MRKQIETQDITITADANTYYPITITVGGVSETYRFSAIQSTPYEKNGIKIMADWVGSELHYIIYAESYCTVAESRGSVSPGPYNAGDLIRDRNRNAIISMTITTYKF